MSDIIRRTRWGIMTADLSSILCGEKSHALLKPVNKVTARDKIVLYESKKKALAALKNSWYMDRLVNMGNICVLVPFEEALGWSSITMEEL